MIALKTINVMISESKPFVFPKHGKPKFDGLDVKILIKTKHFGRKFNLKIEYILANKSLNGSFSSLDRFGNFIKSINES